MGTLMRGLRLVLAASLLVAVAPAPQVANAGQPTLAQLIGQKLVVRMEGTTPSADLLGRIRRGEIGGIILFGSNLTTPAALISLTEELHAAARAGGQPRFLIAVDQEGGPVKRDERGRVVRFEPTGRCPRSPRAGPVRADPPTAWCPHLDDELLPDELRQLRLPGIHDLERRRQRNEQRRDKDESQAPHQRPHGCIPMTAGWPGPLQGGTVASVGVGGAATNRLPSRKTNATRTGGTGAAPQ